MRSLTGERILGLLCARYNYPCRIEKDYFFPATLLMSLFLLLFQPKPLIPKIRAAFSAVLCFYRLHFYAIFQKVRWFRTPFGNSLIE